MKQILIHHNGYTFKKSSFSPYGGRCVGVCVEGDNVLVINTNTRESIIKFTRGEWEAFILGVKNNEFDLGDKNE